MNSNKNTPIWNSKDLAKILNIKILKDVQFNSVEIDSREVKEGSLFIALKGKNFDGHDFIESAIKKGAKGLIISKNIDINTDDIIIFKVKDVYKSIISIALSSIERVKKIDNSKTIAITGSSGKTSTKEMLKTALNSVSKVYANRDSYNNYTGVPYSLINMPSSSEYRVFEIGMNHANEIRPLSNLVNPDIVIITNITDAHIGNFDSEDEIIKAKSEIFEGLNKNGTAIINRDFKGFDKTIDIAKNNGVKKFVTFGSNKNADIKLLKRKQLIDYQKIEAEAFGIKYIYKINFEGVHQAINSLSVLATLILLNLDIKIALNSLSNSILPSGRGNKLVLSHDDGKIVIIDDSYNANPSSVKASINLFSEIAGSNRKILFLGEMSELGTYSKSLHLSLVENIMKNRIDIIIFVGNKTKGIYNLLKNDIKCFWNVNSKSVITSDYIDFILPNDFILVKGSRSMSMEIIVSYIKNIFSNNEENI